MKNRKKKKTVIIVAAAFVLLAAVGTAALRNHGRSTGAGKGTEVMTAPVTRQDISSRLSSSGVLKPRNSYQYPHWWRARSPAPISRWGIRWRRARCFTGSM